jgi:uncharacterized protein
LTTNTDTKPTPPKWLQCNGQQFRKLAHAALLWLEQNHRHVNELNVFPVPDGDTGTNMLLTMRSAYGRIADNGETHVGTVAKAMAHGALMGARGNSGVILSQIWRGLARKLQDKETFTSQELAQALQEAADTAYSGVMRPVEGTILTIIKEAAAEAKDAAKKSQDLRFVLERVLERSQQALEHTPEQLPILKQAGVVDSGGQGLVYILEGMLRYIHGEIKDLEAQAAALAEVRTQTAPAQAHAVPEGGSIENPYDVQFLLMGKNLNVEEVRRRIDAMGDSTVVVGDEMTIKVHIHVKDPGEPLSYGISLGHITDVVVENMQEQMEEIIHVAPVSIPVVETPTIEPGQIGVVAVAAGEGLANIFRSLGAVRIVNGGQTNNPSTEEIFQAIQDVPSNKVIILPNNKNILLAAEAARDLSPKEVAVVPTHTTPQGLSAMLGLNRDGDLEETAKAMEMSYAYVATGEITRATRTVEIDGIKVEEGALLGLVDGRLCASGPEMHDILDSILTGMEMEEREILSIYYGQDVTDAEAAAFGRQIEDRYPDVEIELLPGGQSHYFYILGAE